MAFLLPGEFPVYFTPWLVYSSVPSAGQGSGDPRLSLRGDEAHLSRRGGVDARLLTYTTSWKGTHPAGEPGVAQHSTLGGGRGQGGF